MLKSVGLDEFLLFYFAERLFRSHRRRGKVSEGCGLVEKGSGDAGKLRTSFVVREVVVQLHKRDLSVACSKSKP